jgi:IS1 family transposase
MAIVYIGKNTSTHLFYVIQEYFNLSNIENVFCDGNISYDKYFGNKATCKKSKETNIIENLNSQLRDKIPGLVRKTKAHYKK